MSSVAFRRFGAGVLLYNLAVVVFGAYVRATGSGAGCGSHWPKCNGVVLPLAPTLKTVIEFTHRLTSGVDALLVLALVVWAFFAHPRGHAVRSAAVASGILTLTEALVGAALVIFKLVEKDASVARAVVVSVHLVNTLLLLSALTWTVGAAQGRSLRLRGHGTAAWRFGFALVLVTLLAITGAITALGDTVFPSASLASGMAQDFAGDAHFLVRLRVVHPSLAMATVLYLMLTAFHLAQHRPGRDVRRAAWRVGGLALGQVALGLVNLVLLAPVTLQLLHLLLADVLWIALWALGAAAFGPSSSTEVAAPTDASPGAELVSP